MHDPCSPPALRDVVDMDHSARPGQQGIQLEHENGQGALERAWLRAP